MFSNTKRWRNWIAACALLLNAGAAQAQLPSSVDIDLVPGPTANQMDVRLRANGNSFNELISNLVFTVRWPDSSPATIGLGSSPWCASAQAFPLGPSAQVTPGNGFKYRTYTAVGNAQIGWLFDDGGCEASLPANTWVTVWRLTVSNNTGCTAFNIVNDTYTNTNNRNFFISLNGNQDPGLTGDIDATGVNVGACNVDCLGVIGGTALPGTPCNDNNPCTVNDVYTGIAPNCGCAGTPVAAPVLNTFGSNSPICVGSTLNLNASATGTGTITYSWTGPNGFSSALQNPSITNATTAASGTYTVVASNGCGTDTESFSVTVTAAPSAGTLSGTQAICVGGTSNFSSTVSGGSWSSGNAAVASVNPTTGVVTGVSAGSTTITYTVTGTGGCPNATATRTVTVTAAPSAGTLSGTQAICVGGTSNFSSTVSGGSWSSGNAAVASVNPTTGVVTGVSAGSTTITYTVTGTGGCPNATATRTVTVTAAPSATINYAGSPYCSNAGIVNVTRTGTAGGTYTSEPEVSIDAATGAVNTGLSTPGTFTVTYTVAAAGGCPQFQTTALIIITANATASISYAGSPYCSTSGTVTPSISGATGGIFGSTAGLSINTASGAVNTGASTPGTYTVTYTIPATGGCPQFQTTASITVTAPPSAGTLSGTQAICVGGTSTFSSTVSGGSWSSGNAAVASVNPTTGVVTGVSVGSTTITYTVTGTGGCPNATATRTVTVTAAPSAGTLSGTQAICVGGTSTFSSTVAGGSWSSDNAAVASVNPTTGVVTGVSAGSTTITYTVTGTGGCPNATATRTVTVTATTSNTTTESACDSYTWAVNGTTYTQSGTYTVVNGCATEILVLTITPSTSNTTTQSACDSFTWSVNGVTYTQSGTYSVTTGCNTEILVLTITPSTSNTTTLTQCDSYTWPVNGVTYTQSGTYTSVTGCNTEILVLTIVTSSSNTTTVSECDSYTWNVNGVTYTQSGTYTSVSGCGTQILVLTITPSTSNTTTQSACDSFTWSVNGLTYTQSGTYTVVNGCATEILVLTITPSTSNTTTVSECDSYTWPVNGVTYTQSGTYTVVNGCATQILVLTILQSGTNTTTQSACDSFTWSVNGVTYTQSGTYSVTTGCSTEILVLTITPSTSNTTTVSECDSYTWPVNGTTYTQSGTYTVVNGCATQILVLTILQSGTNTTTQSACDSFTWSVNGVTYTQSGTYTVTTGCSTEILVLTITPSTSNTTTESACDSFTWSVNGVTYTQSGTYSVTTGCATEILVLTITPSGTNTTTVSACGSYTWAVNGTTYTVGGTYTVVSGCTTEVLVLTVSVPGTACDDGNAGTINDQLDANCNCVGVPTGCTNELDLIFTTDNNGNQTSWEITVEGSSTIVCSGGNLPSNAVVGADCCLADGCYALRVLDAAGDGMTTGGYVLQTQAGERIIDNRNNFNTGSVSAISGGQGFCLPMSNQRLVFTSCDKLDWVTGQYMVAAPNPAVSAEWIVGGSNAVQDNNSGYEFWIFDPNGSYSFRRFRSHNQSDLFGPASATRACHMRLNNWAVASQIPQNVLMNVRVRARINGVNGEFGPACRMAINPVLAACPRTNLMDIPGNQFFSCGVFRNWGAGNYVYARPVSGANRYQFRFRQPAEGFEVVRTSTTYFVQLNWAVNPLQNGETYDVDVRISRDGGATWCSSSDPWGNVCQVTIGQPNVNATSLNEGAEVATAGAVKLFPNPTRGDLVTLTMTELAADVNTVSVDIFDLYGKRVMARTIAVADAGVNTVLELNGSLAAGMYLVNITAGDAVTTERMVVQP